MKQPTVLVLFIAAICLFISGCSRSPKEALIGKWQAPDSHTRIEFFSDGSLQVVDGTTNVGGKHTFLEDGRLKIEFNLLGITKIQTLKVTFGDGVMVTIDENGKKEELKRIP